MNEQQRLWTTMLLCSLILFAWQWWLESRQPVAKNKAAPSAISSSKVVPTAPVAQKNQEDPRFASSSVYSNQPNDTDHLFTKTSGQIIADLSPIQTNPTSIEEVASEHLKGVLLMEHAAWLKLVLPFYHAYAHPSSDKDRLSKSGLDEEPTLYADAKGPLLDMAENLPQAVMQFQINGKTRRLSFHQENKEQQGIVLLASEEDLDVLLTIQPHLEQYVMNYELKINNKSSLPLDVVYSVSLQHPVIKNSSWSLFGGVDVLPQGLVCQSTQQQYRYDNGRLPDEGFTSKENIAWLAIDKQYFVLAFVPGIEMWGHCHLWKHKEQAVGAFQSQNNRLLAKESLEQRFQIYAGPKRIQALSLVHSSLADILDYSLLKIPLGFLARPMVYCLDLYHRWTLSWGLAIILLTLSVKVLMFPISYKGIKDMRRMQLLKPQLDALLIKYEDDKEQRQKEQIKFYQEKGLNPLGGCLPLLVQAMVGFALYRTLSMSVDLYQQPFLWLGDLTSREPIPVMSILLAVFTFLQQKMTPMDQSNPQTQTMMLTMPIVFSFLMISMPSGLVLYVLVNNILTIAQQLVINRQLVST